MPGKPRQPYRTALVMTREEERMEERREDVALST